MRSFPPNPSRGTCHGAGVCSALAELMGILILWPVPPGPARDRTGVLGIQSNISPPLKPLHERGLARRAVRERTSAMPLMTHASTWR